jgi:hypothetical protein
MHGGRSTGARSLDGKQRQREGYARYVLRLRGQGRKPGPAKGTGGRPCKRDMLDQVEEQRRDALAALSVADTKRGSPAMTPPTEPRDNSWWTPELEAAIADAFTINPLSPAALAEKEARQRDAEPKAEYERREEEAARAARWPRLAASNPAPVPAPPLPPPELTLVHDRSALASDVEMIAHLAMNRIKATLEKPFDPADQNYQQLLKFVCSIYGTTMNVIVRSDENRLKQRAVDRLPELLERVAAEERKRAARHTIEGTTSEGPDAA